MAKYVFQILLIILVTCSKAQTVFENNKISIDSLKTTSSGIHYYIWKKGNNDSPKPGAKVLIDYVGKFSNDSVFSSTQKSGPLFFYLNSGQLIPGFEEAIMLLTKGASGYFSVPFNLAYGEEAFKNIPAKSDLIFEIELINFSNEKLILPIELDLKNAIKLPSGIRYQTIKNGEGPLPSDGNCVRIHYNGFYNGTKVFDSSYKRGDPLSFIIGDGSVIEAWDIIVRLMKPGEIISVFVPWKLGYGKKGFPPMVAPKTDLLFNIELVSIKPDIQIIPYSIGKNDSLILPKGLKLFWIEHGTGQKIDSGNIVQVHYNGYYSNGKLFDSSIKRGEPITFPLGANLVIPGWEKTLPSCNVGDKIKLFVPYPLGYGKKGNKPQIPPKTDLIFDIEIIDAF